MIIENTSSQEYFYVSFCSPVICINTFPFPGTTCVSSPEFQFKTIMFIALLLFVSYILCSGIVNKHTYIHTYIWF